MTDVEKESFRRPAHAFTDSNGLATAAKKDFGQSRGKRFRIVLSTLRMLREWVSSKRIADMAADSSAGRRPLDEDDGEIHSCCVLQVSCLPSPSQENLRVQ